MVTSQILFTAKQKDELWERWKNGQSVWPSGALERRNKTSMPRIVALNGGIAPAPRCRAVAALKLEEREEISRAMRPAGRSVGWHEVQRSPSTISREIRRNGGSQTYRANHRCVESPGLSSMAIVRDPARSDVSTDRPQSHEKSLRAPQASTPPQLCDVAPAPYLHGEPRSAGRRSCSSFPAPGRWPTRFVRSSTAPTVRPSASK